MKNQFHRRLMLESLERREVFSATVLEAEPNDRSSQATPVFAPADGEIYLAGVADGRADKDFFAFTAPVSGPANIGAKAAFGKNVKLELKTRAGVELFETEPNDGINSGTVELAAGQRYLLRVRSGERSGPVAYTVHLQLQPGGGGTVGGDELLPTTPGGIIVEAESNDRQRTANRFDLAPGGAVRLSGESGKQDKDFFTFTPQSSGEVQAMVFAGPRQRVQFTVEDAQGNKIFETEPNDGVNGGAMNVVAGVKYYLRVRGTRDLPSAYNVDLAMAQLMGV